MKIVEFFQLIFVRALTARLEDKTLVSLKGGCNLRFFFGSVRFSEDIDFDIAVIAKRTLQQKIEALLAGPTVTAACRMAAPRATNDSTPPTTARIPAYAGDVTVPTTDRGRTRHRLRRR